MRTFKMDMTLIFLLICFGVLLCINNLPGRYPHGPVARPDPWDYPKTSDVIAAASRQYNPIASVLNALDRLRVDATPVPGYDPIKRLSGTKDDDLIEQSLADVNPAQTDARIAEKNAGIKDQQTLSAAGWYGTVNITLIFLLTCCFGVLLYRNRRRIAKASDSAVVSGLARGVQFNRKIQAERKSLMDRVNAKVNERTPTDQ